MQPPRINAALRQDGVNVVQAVAGADQLQAKLAKGAGDGFIEHPLKLTDQAREGFPFVGALDT